MVNRYRGPHCIVKILCYLVVREALARVEVEGEDDPGSFEDDRLVVLVLAGHVGGIGCQPPVL